MWDGNTVSQGGGGRGEPGKRTEFTWLLGQNILLPDDLQSCSFGRQAFCSNVTFARRSCVTILLKIATCSHPPPQQQYPMSLSCVDHTQGCMILYVLVPEPTCQPCSLTPSLPDSIQILLFMFLSKSRGLYY